MLHAGKAGVAVAVPLRKLWPDMGAYGHAKCQRLECGDARGVGKGVYHPVQRSDQLKLLGVAIAALEMDGDRAMPGLGVKPQCCGNAPLQQCITVGLANQTAASIFGQ